MKSYTLSSASAFPPLSGGAGSASATGSATKDSNSGGSGEGRKTSEAGPAEENAVRKALGLPPTGAAESRDNHVRASNHLHHSDGGLSGHGREGGGSGGLNQASQTSPGGAPLCLLLSNLGELFRWDAAAAADICADAFPGVRPW